MMFAIYFPICLRTLITRLVPERDKGLREKEKRRNHSLWNRIFLGKAFSFVAFIQNFDILLGTVVCIEIYRASISFFTGLIFLFAVITRLLALLLLL